MLMVRMDLNLHTFYAGPHFDFFDRISLFNFCRFE